MTRLVCNPPWRGIERRMLAVLDGTTDSVLSDASVLVVTRQGRSLVFGVE